MPLTRNYAGRLNHTLSNTLNNLPFAETIVFFSLGVLNPQLSRNTSSTKNTKTLKLFYLTLRFLDTFPIQTPDRLRHDYHSLQYICRSLEITVGQIEPFKTNGTPVSMSALKNRILLCVLDNHEFLFSS